MGLTTTVTSAPSTVLTGGTDFTISFVTRTGSKFTPTVVPAFTGNSDQAQVARVQDPSPPLSGSWTLKNQGLSQTLKFDAADWQVQEALRQVGYTPLIRTSRYGLDIDGAEWRFAFFGNPGTQPLIEVASLDLDGCRDPTKIAVQSSEIQAASLTGAWYETIPVNFLRTSNTAPQVTVTTNGLTSNCPAFNCDYNILSTGVPSISSISYSGTTLTVVITTSNTYTASNFDVKFANSACTGVSWSASTLTATCVAPEFGTGIKPKIHISGANGKGYADASSATGVTIAGSIATATTSSGNQVNKNGGTMITLTGTNFPVSLAAAQNRLAITVAGSPATIISVSSTQIVCINTAATGNPSSATITVTLNSATLTSTLSFLSSAPTITAVNVGGSAVTWLNPVLQTNLTIAGTGFDSAANGATTTVSLQNDATHEIVVIYVKNNGNSATQISAIYLGAASGQYHLWATTSNGNSNQVAINVGTQITSVSPTSGSLAGGTILTINGNAFSTDTQQTLAYVGGEDDWVMCDVLTSSASQVTCRTRAASPTFNAGDAKPVTIASRIQEESQCAGTCSFTYDTAKTASVTALSPAGPYNPGDTLTFTGSGFGSSAPTLTIGAVTLTVSANSDTSITAQIPANAQTVASALVQVYVPNNGYAKFDPSINQQGSVQLSISSISPSSGSASGALLTVNGNGFSASTTITVGGLPCLIRSKTITQIVCRATSSGAVRASDLQFINVGGSSLGSGATGPSVTGATLSAGTLTVTGTGFNAPVLVNLVSSANPANVFPITVTGTATSQSGSASVPGGIYNVEVSSNGVIGVGTLTVAFTATLSNTQSSVAGGATLAITGTGIDTNIANIQVKVCGLAGTVTAATATTITAQTPMFLNAASRTTYPNIIQPQVLTGTWTADDMTKVQNAYDNAGGTAYGSANAAGCWIRFDIGAGTLADITELRYFPDTTIQTLNLVGSVVSGSNDGSTWTTIYTVDSNIASGWNWWNTPSGTTVRYRYYQWSGTTTTGKCAWAELAFVGYLISDKTGNPTPGVTCDTVISVNGNTQTVSSSVTYTDSNTPTITGISPTYGTSAGGTTLTITGTGLAGTSSVKIDGVTCAVQGSPTATQVVCLTGVAPAINFRRNSLASELTVATSNGMAVSNGIQYLYVDKWSDLNTWGGINPPSAGDSVLIPSGQNVLLDVSSPILNAIIIQGALIVDDADLTLDASYIIIRQGRLQIGTWDKPITH